MNAPEMAVAGNAELRERFNKQRQQNAQIIVNAAEDLYFHLVDGVREK